MNQEIPLKFETSDGVSLCYGGPEALAEPSVHSDVFAETDKEPANASNFGFLTMDQALDILIDIHSTQFSRGLREAVAEIWNDQSGKSLEELYRLASAMDPRGSTHVAGFLIRDILEAPVLWKAGKLLAVCIRSYWKGGKLGFCFLPNANDIDTKEYDALAIDLTCSLSGDESGWDDDEQWGPRDLLLDGIDGPDLQFYDSLPKRVTVYRGGFAITPEKLAAGVCWTTSRPIAEWFARRWSCSGETPVLVSARVEKWRIATVFASEMEVVCLPLKYRALKCPVRKRKKLKRPPMEWSVDGPID